MDTSGVIQLIVVIISVGLSAFFSSAGTALSSVNRARIKALSDEGRPGAAIVLKILDNHGKMSNTILTGKYIAGLTASSLVTILALTSYGSYTIAIAAGILILVLLLVGEIIPQSTAMIYPETYSLLCSRPVLFFMYLFTPISYILGKTALGISRLFHADIRQKGEFMTEDELKTYVDASHEEGVIESEEREIIYNVFDFIETMAKDVMIPRIDMVSVGLDMTYDEVLNIFKESMYTRLPVYEEHKDNIVGLINIKDFILLTDKENFHVKDILREAYYTYEYKKTSDLMIEMREIAANVAFIMNEYGATAGMITMEDLLEEIVGEIRDEYDGDEEELIQQVDDNTYLVEGGMKLDDINAALETNLESEDYDSIGGLIIESLDRLPSDEETIVTAIGITLQVKGIGQNRIKKVLMTLPAKTETAELESTEKESSSEYRVSGTEEDLPEKDDSSF